MKVNRLLIRRRNNTNKNNCGVYAMFHMKTYMGDEPDLTMGSEAKMM